jgi:hypothetical protein
MKPPIFLSASVPNRDLNRYLPEPDLIRQAILALVAVSIPRRLLVFGGHPAISPLVEHAARSLKGVNKVHIYQSRLFQPVIPPEAKKFHNLHWTKVVRRSSAEETRRASLTEMRTKMIKSLQFGAAVFIGGMDGVEEEWELFGQQYPDAPRIPVASTKGAAMLLWRLHSPVNQELNDELRYRTLFRKYLP